MKMGMGSVRRMAADILGVGERKIRFHTDSLSRIKEALTRTDVRERIDEGIIYALPRKGRRKKERKRRSSAARRGFSARTRKKEWMRRIRAQRRYLVQLLREGQVEAGHKRSLYRKVKSGIFRSKQAFRTYLEENQLLRKGEKP